MKLSKFQKEIMKVAEIYCTDDERAAFLDGAEWMANHVLGELE